MKEFTTNQVRYLKMQNRIFNISGRNPYKEGVEKAGIADYVKDEDVLVLPLDHDVLVGFARWLYTGIEQHEFKTDMIMSKNRKLAEYFDDSTVQIVAASFIHSDERVALLEIFENRAFRDSMLTMIQGHVTATEEFVNEVKENVIDNEDKIGAAINFNGMITMQAMREIMEEVTLKDPNENVADWMKFGKVSVVYYPVIDDVSRHIAMVYDVYMPDHMLDELVPCESDKHRAVKVVGLEDLHHEVNNLDPWVVAYIASGRPDYLDELYTKNVFELDEDDSDDSE